jgi:two-component system OmpR family response regulator
MKILVAEDDVAIAEALSYSLRKAGYSVEAVHDGEAVETALAATERDLLILDLGLPRKSGLEVLRTLRQRGSRLPVLILTALDDVVHRVKGLDAGADDYLHKPFELSELEARVRALARRGKAGKPTLLGLGELTFDRTAQVARLHGEPLDLTPRESAFLEILLERAGRLVSRARIADQLGEWGEDTSEIALELYAQRLRERLEPAGLGIVSVPALGYSLEKMPPERGR